MKKHANEMIIRALSDQEKVPTTKGPVLTRVSKKKPE